MSTTTKVAYRQLSNSVVAETSVESDELAPQKVLEFAKKLADDAQTEATAMTMRMRR